MPLASPQALFEARKDVLADAIRRTADAVAKHPADARHPALLPQACLVGGYVRDLLLGLPSLDADMEVYNLPAEALQALLEGLFPGNVHLVGKSFGIYKIRVSEGHDLDVALPRRERKSGTGHKGFDVEPDPFLDPVEAARRRDFTVNAIAFDPLSGELIDPYGGMKDLEARILRVVDAKTFVEDPLRAFRAVQLAARFALTVDVGTLDVLQDLTAGGETDSLSHERIGQEMKKLLLLAEKPSLGLTLAKDIGLIGRHFPHLNALIGTPQDPEWHPEGDVWVHTLMVVDEAAHIIRQTDRGLTDEEKFQTMFGALCHDLGKPATTQTVEGRIRSRGHEEAGSPQAQSLALRLTFPYLISQAASAIASEHLKPSALYADLQKGTLDAAGYANAVRRLLRRLLPLGWKPFIAACEADWRGRGIPERHTAAYDIGKTFVEAIERDALAHEAATPLLQGRDLLELGLEPGPRVGEIIRAIEDKRDAGEVRSKEDALAAAKRLL